MERVKLLLNNCFCNEWCVKCGMEFPAGDTLPEVYDEENRLIGYLCNDCLSKHQKLNLVAY